MNCKTCTIKPWACEACELVGKKNKPVIMCSKCGKNPVTVKGKCKSCYYSDRYDQFRKKPKVEKVKFNPELIFGVENISLIEGIRKRLNEVETLKTAMEILGQGGQARAEL
ncbi:MAG: hypothetical protein WC389_18025, partial [Lutibacter sp.]